METPWWEVRSSLARRGWCHPDSIATGWEIEANWGIDVARASGWTQQLGVCSESLRESREADRHDSRASVGGADGERPWRQPSEHRQAGRDDGQNRPA